MDVIDTIYTLPQRYYPAMLLLLLSLRRISQARFEALAETIALRALERRLNETDVRELAQLLGDRRADDELFDWFLATPHAHPIDVRERLERPRVEGGDHLPPIECGSNAS